MIQPITDDVPALLRLLPSDVAAVVGPLMHETDELKLRFGRPLMRLRGGHWEALELVVDHDHLLDVNARVLAWRDDGRKGVEGTCHRLSRVLNAEGVLEGVTVRVGRFLRGVAEPLRPFLARDPSMLVLGPPGSGKSTLERDVARIVSETLGPFCVVVDTSGELSGDGRRAHPGIGFADRVSVPRKAAQADLIWEVVRNHNPRVLIVDEIGYAGDAGVIARASRLGVKTVATAHGETRADFEGNAELAPVRENVFRWLVVAARGVYRVHDLAGAGDPIEVTCARMGES